MNLFSWKKNSDKRVVESEAELKKNESIQIAEVKALRETFKGIQDAFENSENDLFKMFNALENDKLTPELASDLTKEIFLLTKREMYFGGAADSVVNTCKLAIETDKDLRNKVAASNLMKYDPENSSKEIEELKTLTKEEIEILNAAEDLVKCVNVVLKFSRKITSIEENIDDEEELDKFKLEITKMKEEFTKVKNVLLKAQEDLNKIDATLKNVVLILNDVENRLHTSLKHISNRIIVGQEYRPSNPSGR